MWDKTFSRCSEESIHDMFESLRKIASAFAADLRLTINNSKSASRKIAQLIRGR